MQLLRGEVGRRMIIQYSDTNENRIYWQHRRGGEWKTAELDELIEAYERATEPGDLISREQAIKAIEDLQDCYNGFSSAYDKACIIGVLEELPSAEKTGEWINYKDEHRCSCCGEVITGDWFYEDEAYSYCPNCGARMEE